MARHHIGHRGGGATIADKGEVGAGLLLEELHGERRRRADARAAILVFAGLGLGGGDQLGDGVVREAGMAAQEVGLRADPHHGLEVGEGVVGGLA